MKRILVTGANGCTGRGVLQYLVSKGYTNIYGMVRKEPKVKIPNVNYTLGDLTDRVSINKILRDFEIDSIWHIGAVVHTNVKKKDFARVNFEGTKNIIQAAIDNNVKSIIFASTTAVYGKIVEYPASELHPTKPLGLYAKSKLNAEILIKLLCEENGIKGGIIRIPIIIGKNDRHFFPVVEKLVKINLMPIIGKPLHKVAIVHPYDIGQAFEIIDQNSTEEIDCYNVVSYNSPYKELVDTVEKYVVGRRRLKLYLPYYLIFGVFVLYELFHLLFKPRKQPIINREYARMIGKEWFFDTSKLEKLGFSPKMNLNNIIKDAVDEAVIPVPS